MKEVDMVGVYRSRSILNEMLDKVSGEKRSMQILSAGYKPVSEDLMNEYIQLKNLKLDINLMSLMDFVNNEGVPFTTPNIFGNPPFQGNHSNKKLYPEITLKMLDEVLLPGGVMDWIIPKSALLMKKSNKVNNKLSVLLQKYITEIDFTADEFFPEVGDTLMRIKIVKSPRLSKIKVFRMDRSVVYVDRITDAIDSEDGIDVDSYISIMKKLHIGGAVDKRFADNGYNSTLNQKMEIVKSGDTGGWKEKDVSDITEGYPLYRSGKSEGRLYTKSRKCGGKERLVISYVGGWLERGAIVTTDEITTSWYVNRLERSSEVLHNMAAYLNSPLVSYVVVLYNKLLKEEANYNFLSRLVGVDFSRPWTDEQLYQEFELTNEEIEEVDKFI